MKKVFAFCSMLFILLMISAQVVYAEEETKRHGLVEGLLKQVDSTVKDTTKSVGKVVESTVEGTQKTVEETVSVTKDIVRTVVEPTTEKPISSVVNKTVEHVGKTVENVTPVVENTTATVTVVTKKVEEVVEELPEIPVVKEVVKEVGSVVHGTGQSVTDTVDKTVNDTVKVVKNLPPSEAKKPVQKPIEKPIDTSVPEKERIEPERHSKVEDQTMTDNSIVPLEGKSPTQEPTDVSEEKTDVAFVVKEQTVEFNVARKREASIKTLTAEKAEGNPTQPVIPKRPQPMSYDHLAAITTSMTSISSQSVVTSGVADYVMDVESWIMFNQPLEGRQWIHSSKIMRNQWTHAPPGQPPKQTPFLQVNQNN